MPSSRRSAITESDEDEPVMAERANRKRSVVAAVNSDDEDDGMQDEESADQFIFSSQCPDMSQAINPVKSNELNKFMLLPDEKREKAVADLTRAVLFKALSHEAIDRVKCAKDAGIDGKLANALYEQVQSSLQNIFGFELIRIPAFMENMKCLPEKYKNRYYLINSLPDQHGTNHKRLHSVHDDCAKDKGLLMMVLGLAYCHGLPRLDGSRWILDRDLYNFLHQMDEYIPSEPPEAGSRRKRTISQHSQSRGSSLQTPDVDTALEMFEKRDYLLKMKAGDINPKADGTLHGHFYYGMGPRAALEIGRKQVIYFCSEVLDQEVEPQMLEELDADSDEDES